MVWVGAITIALAVGVPIVAWSLSRKVRPWHVKPWRPAGRWLSAGETHRWLMDHYQLGARDRWQVAHAVLGGGKLQPRLREPARGLAAALLSGELKTPGPTRPFFWMIIGLGLAQTTFGLIGVLASHQDRGLGLTYLIEGPFGMACGAAGLVWAPRQLRRRLLRYTDDPAGDGRSGG
jgi:hypothetical protein